MTSWGMRSGHNEAVLKICRSSGSKSAETHSDNQAKWVCVYTSERAQIAPRQLGKTEQMHRIRTRSGLCRKEYYFATAKIAKTRISNVISNTFQNYNLIRRNIEAVTTRRSWKFAVASFCKCPKSLATPDVFALRTKQKIIPSKTFSKKFANLKT